MKKNNNKFKIKGGKKLSGTIIPQGAKNEALQVICASLLTEEEVTILNIPMIQDILKLFEILEGMNVSVKKLGKNSYKFKSNKINIKYLRTKKFAEQMSSLRGSLMIIGPLLARFGKVIILKPGGDKIGVRPIDVHLNGFKKLGVKFNSKTGDIYEGVVKKLKGNYIHLEEPSVTGTANIVMAAVLADGKTTIFNAACEPYLKQLCRMLNTMGAKIKGGGTNKLIIDGVEKLNGCKHKILPDMIEVGSFIGLGALIGSGIRIKDVHYDELGLIPNIFKKLGITIKKEGDDIFIPEHKNYKIEEKIGGGILKIYDGPWPGFTPDLMSILLVTAIQGNGNILIHQKMFDGRLFFVDSLIEMGAHIILCDPHRAIVIGFNRKRNLKGIKMISPDIRAGVALLFAALSAEGESIIQNIHQIDRGYENIEGRLKLLGAEIERV